MEEDIKKDFDRFKGVLIMFGISMIITFVAFTYIQDGIYGILIILLLILTGYIIYVVAPYIGRLV